MEFAENTLHLRSFLTFTLGIIVLLLGKVINDRVKFLKDFSIPEPVTGGLLFTILFNLAFVATGITTTFDMAARDFLLLYFFSTIGINANLRDLVRGGKPLIILLIITIGYMFLQNLTGISVAKLFGLPEAVGLLGGTVSLIGGHGTSIAWSPQIAETHGIENAMEIGIACATFGLILASLMGGPTAKFLIGRYKLSPEKVEPLDVGSSTEGVEKQIGYLDFLNALLAIHLALILGYFLDMGISALGLDLPMFVSCLFAGILLTNTAPISLFRKKTWPNRTPAMALIADVSLGAFLAMSLMSMQLSSLVSLAIPILAILVAQFTVAVLVMLFAVFPAMGKNYDAAVICSGFGGISLGSTPTAMANMAAVSQRYGASHVAFIVVPLVCAFFIDLANAFMIPFFLERI
jgi:ESS family glutamate:Na+ symporter